MTQLASRQALLGTETAFETLAKAKELERQGKSITHLEIGEPDFDTPEHIRDAAKQALDDGFTHYGASAGQMELREAIAKHQTERQGYEVSASSVIVTPGGKPVMFFTIMALVEQGVEVIYPNPGFPIYESMINYMGGTAVPMQLNEETGYNADIDNLRSLITPRTKLLIVNSPNNPCGSVIPESDLEKIAEMAVENDLVVLADEIYKDMYYNGLEHVSITKFPGMRERTIILDGFSKSYAMTGWRLGYAANRLLAPYFTTWVANTDSCANHITQWAGVEAITGDQSEHRAMMDSFTRRRNLIVEGLNTLPGIHCLRPGGAFYVWPNVSELCQRTGCADAEALRKRWLYEANVAVLADSHFGPPVPGEGQHVRFSYAASEDNINQGLEKLRQWIGENGG